jgi:hypothetical protein
MRVWIQNNPQSKTLAHINETLTQFSQVELSSDFESSNLVVVEKNGEITLRTPDDVPLGIPRPANDDAAVQIGHDILKWAHWFYLMSMDNPGSPLKVELTVSKKGTRGETRGLDQIGKAEMTFKAGETASIVVTNSSTRKLYVTVLALSTDGTVAVLLPDSAQQGAAVELAPGKSYPPIEPTASIPECISSTRDIIKVIATSVPVDLRELEQSTSVCSRSTTRNLTSKNAGDLLAGTSVWTTVRKVVEVVP